MVVLNNLSAFLLLRQDTDVRGWKKENWMGDINLHGLDGDGKSLTVVLVKRVP